MEIEKGEGGHVKRLEKLFKNANFEQVIICFDNSFITDVIGSRKVGTILKYKGAYTSPHIEHRKSFHEKLGLVMQRRLAIILKIRSKLTPFFFEDSDLPPIIGSEIREQYPGSFMDFNIIDRICDNTENFKQKSKRKRLRSIIFCKITFGL